MLVTQVCRDVCLNGSDLASHIRPHIGLFARIRGVISLNTSRVLKQVSILVARTKKVAVCNGLHGQRRNDTLCGGGEISHAVASNVFLALALCF